VFMQPCEVDRDYIKRVVALENDTVEVRCNVVYVNGKPIQNELTEAAPQTETTPDACRGAHSCYEDSKEEDL